VIPPQTRTSAPADVFDTFTCLEAAAATGKPSPAITPGYSAARCCLFVTDANRRQMRYSCRRHARFQSGTPDRVRPVFMPKLFTDPEAIAEDIIRDVGTNLVVGLPLGLGKANHIANALYARASADRSINLTFFSALTLEKPRPANLLERRFIAPVIERLFGGYPDLAYADALHAGELPPNVQVIEFFFLAGSWLHVPFAQQHYISANYTHAASYLLARGLNVIAQLVAKRVVDGVARYSLSCNTDTTLDVMRARSDGRAAFKLVAQVNSELPFMPGLGDLAAEEFSAVLDSPKTDFPLFAPPSEPITDAKYAIGLHAAGLVRDGGTLQIGIGQVGDALAQGLILRHRDNSQFHAIMKRLAPDVPVAAKETGPFDKGLYGVSEILFEAFLGLIEAGIIKREVDGVLLHGAFFLGPKSFYRALREMTPQQLARIQMMPVSFTNQLYGDEEVKRRARVDARFVNNAMMATLMGAVISDGLENGQVVSGVGGQYNFVAQAFELEGARSILTVEAARREKAANVSNIRWNYGHTTIPRHLRDIIVTEYGVADLKGKSDADVIASMLQVADSRFQADLMRQAKDAGKLPKNHEIPAAHRENFSERIVAALKPARDAGLLPSFPFGSDFTDTEQRLIPALQLLQDAQRSPLHLPALLWQGFTHRPDAADSECLARLGLDRPATLAERAYRALVTAALVQSRPTVVPANAGTHTP
jgi:Acetyl-CoA hydrolase/transferase C-terminal domain